MIKTMTDYQELFKNNVIIISGFGRSGTTILGKIIGSMENTVYLFEPALIKYISVGDHIFLSGEEAEILKQTFLGTLFEDYVLPGVQGRSLSSNPKDWTYVHNHISKEELEKRQSLNRRADAMEWIKKNNPTIVIKTNESQDQFDLFRELFPKCKIIHITRSGIDAVASSMERNWYGNDYEGIEFADENNIPLFIPRQERVNWINYNRETRAAMSWRILNRKGIIFKGKIQVSYEDMCSNPEITVEDLCIKLGLVPTQITKDHIKSIKKPEREEISLDDIQSPERERFFKAMESFGYGHEIEELL